MSIQVLNSTSAADWNAFVRSQRNWTHFHLYGWRSVLERVFNHECLYLEARSTDGDLTAVIITLTELPAAGLWVSVPRLQVTVVVPEQVVPLSVVAETRDNPGGSGSVTTTLGSLPGP
jgi:hypothetical protein